MTTKAELLDLNARLRARCEEMNAACLALSDALDRAKSENRQLRLQAAVLTSRHGGEPAVLLRELDAARSALREVRDLIAGYVDVRDGSDGRPTPNNAMHATQLIDEVLKEAT